MSIKSVAQIMAEQAEATFEEETIDLLGELDLKDLRRAALDLLRDLQGSQQRKEIWEKAEKLRVMLKLESYVG